MLKRLITFSFLVISLAVFTPTQASELTIYTRADEVDVNGDFEVVILLDTQGKSINAIEGRLVFPGELLDLKTINDGGSIVNLWVERPILVEGASEVKFSGLIPGGYDGAKGLILSVLFHSKQTGQGVINLADMRLLLNDGEGTQDAVTIKASNFEFFPAIEATSAQKNIDTVAPEEFEPQITSDINVYSGKKFVVFAAQDKGSGLDHYEILESYRYLTAENFNNHKFAWHRTESPALLRNQDLTSYVYIKAVDREGNFRVMTLWPQNPRPLYSKLWPWAMMILGFGLIGLVYQIRNRFLK